MTEDTRIRKSATAAWREIDGQVAIISTDVNRFRLLNKVGAFIWTRCEDATVGQLVTQVCARFAVDEATARTDVRTFIDDLVKRGLASTESAG